eukprot:4982389-Alexandrium_andersonii.AAC.1
MSDSSGLPRVCADVGCAYVRGVSTHAGSKLPQARVRYPSTADIRSAEAGIAPMPEAPVGPSGGF